MSRENTRVYLACFGSGFVAAAFSFLLCRYAPNAEYHETPKVVVVPLFFWGLSALLGMVASAIPLITDGLNKGQPLS